MRNKQPVILISLFLIAALLSGCNMPRSSSTSPEQTAIIQTAVAMTVAAGDPQSGQPPGETAISPTAMDTNTVEISPTANSTATPASSETPTETPVPCNLAQFVKDVNVPDGKKFPPEFDFTKTWRLKNIGSCAWTSGYEIIFDGGDAMGAPSAVQLTGGTVDPGESVDISVDLTSPASAGTYRGNWKLRDPSDVVFGIENSPSGYFWVEIEVVLPTDTPTPSTTPSPTNTPMIFIKPTLIITLVMP
jgi:hypothetical protein